MSTKSAVHYSIQKKLGTEQNVLRNKISINKYRMKRFVEEQTLMKRKLRQ